MKLAALLISMSLIVCSTVWSSPAKPRPLAGIGILFIPVSQGESGTMILYRDPGTGRITESELTDFPSMAISVRQSANLQHVAVTRKKGEWLKVIFDDSGREGWLKAEEGWEFRSWQHYLKGQEVSPLNGLRKELYQLRSAPSPSSPPIATVGKEKSLRVVELEDAWILVLVDFASSGWIRWKDDDGRLLISVGH